MTRKIKDKYIAILPGIEDRDVAITGSSIDTIMDDIVQYLNDNVNLDDEEIDDYIDTQGGIKIYKAEAGHTIHLTTNIETEVKLIWKKEKLQFVDE
jgi:hypothetical protein